MVNGIEQTRRRLATLMGDGARKVVRARAARFVAAGNRQRDARNWVEAAAAYGEALRIAPFLAGIWVQYGHALKESGSRERAEAAYVRATEEGLDDADVHLQLGHVRKLRGARSLAIASYLAALERDPGLPDPLIELGHLGLTRDELRARLSPVRSSGSQIQGAAGARPVIVFDISDVVQYAMHARRPTGIQRVQLAVISAALAQPRPEIEVRLVAFSAQANTWIEIGRDVFARTAELMQAPGDRHEPAWRRHVGTLVRLLMTADDAQFPPGARLVNLGSSWAIGNYFLALRRARSEHAVVYIPFVHDCIPMVAPDYFVPDLQRDFRVWMRDIAEHADGFLTNSNATRTDFERICADLGYPGHTAVAIPLDAAFDRPPDPDLAVKSLRLPQLAHGLLQPRGFALLVATIEPRKNHELVLDAWADMIARRGAHKVPVLVCVGGRGWRNGPIMARIDELRRSGRVVLLDNISDAELGALYASCRFTIYPSRYEGWGLPVTESLSHGRVPLVARTSSLPEAGGDLAVYFDVDDAADFGAKLKALIDDDAMLARLEARIADEYTPRSWAAIATDVIEAALAVTAAKPGPAPIPVLPEATFVRFGKDRPGAIASGVANGEALRRGSGWAAPDDGSCAIVSPQPCELVFRMVGAARHDPQGLRVHLDLAGDGVRTDEPASDGSRDDGHRHVVHVTFADGPSSSYRLAAGEHRWVLAHLPAVPPDGIVSLSLEVTRPSGEPRRGIALRIMGLYVCGESDAGARHRFLEGVVLGAISEPVPVPAAELGMTMERPRDRRA